MQSGDQMRLLHLIRLDMYFWVCMNAGAYTSWSERYLQAEPLISRSHKSLDFESD